MANSQLPLFFPPLSPSPLSRKSGQDTRNSRVEELLLPTFLSPFPREFFSLPFSPFRRVSEGGKRRGGRGRKEEGSSTRVGSSLSGGAVIFRTGELASFFSLIESEIGISPPPFLKHSFPPSPFPSRSVNRTPSLL